MLVNFLEILLNFEFTKIISIARNKKMRTNSSSFATYSPHIIPSANANVTDITVNIHSPFLILF